MVGKFIAWLLRRDGYLLVDISARLRDLERLNKLEQKCVELDSVIVSTMECVEEIKDKQRPAAPTARKDDVAQILNEFFWGYQQPRGDDE